MALKLFIDNDALIKLAHWRLLDAFLASLGATWAEVGVLSSIRFRARRCDAKLFLDPEIAKELAENLNSAAEVPEPDRDVFNRLQDVVGLDAGEVELVAACVATPGAYLVSGDKRAMEALAQPELADVALLLAGRIICLEQALVMLVESYPASSVISAIAPRREIDTAIRCVVGAAGCSEDNFREGLGSYIADLRKKTGPLLCMCPLE